MSAQRKLRLGNRFLAPFGAGGDSSDLWDNRQNPDLRYVWGINNQMSNETVTAVSINTGSEDAIYTFPHLFREAGTLRAVELHFATAPGNGPGRSLICGIYDNNDSPINEDVNSPRNKLYTSPEFGDWTLGTQSILMLPNLAVSKNSILHLALTYNAAFAASVVTQYMLVGDEQYNVAGLQPSPTHGFPPNFSGEGLYAGATTSWITNLAVRGHVQDRTYDSTLPDTFAYDRLLYNPGSPPDNPWSLRVPFCTYYFTRDA